MMWQAFAEMANSVALESTDISEAATLMWEVHDLCTQTTAEGFAQEASERLVADHERRSALLELLLRGPLADRHALSFLAAGPRLPAEGPYIAIVTEAADAGVNPMPDLDVQLRSLWPAPECGWRESRSPAPEPHSSTSASSMSSPSSWPRSATPTSWATSVTACSAVSIPCPRTNEPFCSRRSKTWLDAGGSSEAAAVALFCHPNTVRHRLRRLEAATGPATARPTGHRRPLSRTRRSAPLVTAQARGGASGAAEWQQLGGHSCPSRRS